MRGSGAFRTSIVPGGALAGPWVANSLWKNARAVPSLDLRFAENKSLTDAKTGASLVTFTRASTATYAGSDGLIKTATTNEARFDHDPTIGESLGLLVEEARTNTSTGSEDFSNTYWGGSNAVRTNNSGVAPNGTTTACLVAGSGVAFGALVRKSVIFAASTTYSFSCFAKAGTYNFIGLRPTDSAVGGGINYCYFNLTTGVATAITPGAGTVVSVSMQPFPNGWYRCVMVYTTSATQPATGNVLDISLVTSTGSHGYDGTGNVLIWGAQLETGSFATSYIPTVASTVTRAADVASIVSPNVIPWFTSFDESTFYVELRGGIPKGVGSILLEGAVAGVISGLSIVLISSNTKIRTLQRHGISRFDDASNGPNLSSTTNRVAIGTSASGSQSATNGILPAGSSPPAQTDWTAAASISIGKRSNSSTLFLGGCISRITYWPTRLSNAELQALTAP